MFFISAQNENGSRFEQSFTEWSEANKKAKELAAQGWTVTQSTTRVLS